MFRNPRENATLSSEAKILPSTGRAPSPVHSHSTPKRPLTGSTATSATTAATTSPFFNSTGPATQPHSAGMATTPAKKMPVLGAIPQSRISTAKKGQIKQNRSILNFFGKAEKKEEPAKGDFKAQDTLFFNEMSPQKPTGGSEAAAHVSPPPAELPDVADWPQDDPSALSRYNESQTPVKRRRISAGHASPGTFVRTPPSVSSFPLDEVDQSSHQKSNPLHSRKRRGGFEEDDSSDEEQGLHDIPNSTTLTRHIAGVSPDDLPPTGDSPSDIKQIDGYKELTHVKAVPLKPAASSDSETSPLPPEQRPHLARHGTSGFQVDEFGPDDFEDEFFPEGEEFMERQFMQDQLALERAFDDESKSESGTDGPRTPLSRQTTTLHESDPSPVPECPMCSGAMMDMSETEISRHVNACMDGNAPPLPKVPQTKPETPLIENISTEKEGEEEAVAVERKRFSRAAIARPAQANPFEKSSKATGAKSAFEKIMTGNAENKAWSDAASREVELRGRPAYLRTCPFYKIMPGMAICVDAFRYGKVSGQNAYFLSHFHSDHYIGLSSNWSHGPIYASRVSCNLMRQQLGVPDRYLCPLEFEQKVEVPDTDGVFVTMIPANHCPGSSLFLFEQVTGKTDAGKPITNRILHCGDFRACPAHIHHPLLRPDVMDAVSGQLQEQKIDTCYLDTTYLTPKYAFPSQSDVIDACAQMCVSLSKEVPDCDDAWEQAKRKRQGQTMTKFLSTGGSNTSPIKAEGSSAVPTPDTSPTEDKSDSQARGRLLVVVGTYSIGKERMCMGIAHALGSKIYAPPPKMRICKALQDEELNALLTPDPYEAQVHMQMLMEIRAETLHDYMLGFKSAFSRVVGFRPTGWSYRPPSSRFTENPSVEDILHGEGWKSRFTLRDLVPQRGSTKDSNCFGVPYSEHSSFRELTMFCCALRIGRIIPTVNVGSANSRNKMKKWIDKWEAEKRRVGLFKVSEENIVAGWGSGDGKLRYGV